MRVLYFAWVREAVGTGEEEVAPPADVLTVADLVRWLRARSDGHARALAEPGRLRAAVDQAFVDLDVALGDAREVAIFPPVTGG